MRYLLDALSDFQMEQIEKFVLRIPKHNDGTNVCDDKDWIHYINDEAFAPKPNLNVQVLEKHLIEEVCEYFGFDNRSAKYGKSIKDRMLDWIESENGIRNEEQTKETIDIANLAFLIWTVKQ